MIAMGALAMGMGFPLCVVMEGLRAASNKGEAERFGGRQPKRFGVLVKLESYRRTPEEGLAVDMKNIMDGVDDVEFP